MESKHCHKLISLLNFENTSDSTDNFVMAVIILRIIISHKQVSAVMIYAIV